MVFNISHLGPSWHDPPSILSMITISPLGCLQATVQRMKYFNCQPKKLVNLPFWPFNSSLFGAPSRGVWSLWVQSYWMILRRVFTPQSRKIPRFRSPGGAILGSFFLVANFLGTKKTNAAESCCFCFFSFFSFDEC